MERKELNIEEVAEINGGALRSTLYEGQTEGTLTSTKAGGPYHYDPVYHEEIGKLIVTPGISEVEKVALMKERKWIY